MDEPSVLDLLLSKLNAARGRAMPPLEGSAGPDSLSTNSSQEVSAVPAPAKAAVKAAPWPWRSLLAVGLALFAQVSLEPSPQRTWITAVILYALAFGFLALAYWRNEWQLTLAPEAEKPADDSLQAGLVLRVIPFSGSILLLAAAFYAFGGNRFTTLNVTLWMAGIALFLAAIWNPAQGRSNAPTSSDIGWRSGRQVFLNPRIQFVLAPSALAALFILVALFDYAVYRFNTFNVILGVLGLLFAMLAVWMSDHSFASAFSRLVEFARRGRWQLTITPATLWFAAFLLLAAFFRYYRLEQVPPEMVSDQAEKLLDIWDVMQGQTSIFFPRNTGREAFQMYLTAAVIQIFGTGFSFLSMKIGTATAGMLTLPYIYLLGKEIGSRRAGLLAMAFAGIAFWPNVIARIGLRFALYPLFVAPALYYLVRGIRRKSLNDFILSGVALGIGLHGYTPIRILPFVLVIAVVIYLLHRHSSGLRGWATWGLALLALTSFAIFLPLLRYSLENPEMFAYRSFTRLGTLERAYPEPVWQIFLKNLWNSLVMPVWDNGEIWVHSVTHRPALDWITAALFVLGAGLVLLRYIRRRNWLDIFLLVSIPLLMMPSILSLAFPAENPSLNRSGGAYVPIFLLVGLALDSLMRVIAANVTARRGSLFAWGVAVILLAGASLQNYDLLFNQYYQVYKNSSWNTSEMGRLIRNFAESVGTPDSAWVMGYPHWVDTRLVGLNAGYPTKDYALFPEQIPQTLDVPGPKMFLLRPDDTVAVQALLQAYPLGTVSLHPSEVAGHEFLVYFVPP